MLNRFLRNVFLSPENNPAFLWSLLAAVILLGMAPRIWGFQKYSDEFYANDGMEYRDISEQLYNGNGFSVSAYRWYEANPPGDDRNHALHTDFSRPPLFPLLGSLLFYLPFDWTLSAKIVCLLLSAACSMAVFLLGKELFGKTTGLLAALIYTFYPYSIYYSISWSSENLFLLLLVLGLFFLLPALRGDFSPKHALFSGICWGLLVLTRPQGFVFIPILVVTALAAFLLRRNDRKKIFRISLCCGSAILLILAPWMLRNYRAAGIPTPLTFYGPYSFCQASSDVGYLTYRYLDSPEYTPKTDAEWERFHREKRTFLANRGLFSLPEANPCWKRWAWEYIRENPDKTAYIVFSRIRHWFRACPNLIILPDSVIFLLRSYFTVFLFLALSGLWFARKNLRSLCLLVPPLCGLAMTVPFLMVLRYRYPFFAPFASVLAAYGFYRLVLLFPKKRSVKASLKNTQTP